MIEVSKEYIKEILDKIGGKKQYHILRRFIDDSIVLDGNVLKKMISEFMENFFTDENNQMVPDDILKLCYYSYISGFADTMHRIDSRNKEK